MNPHRIKSIRAALAENTATFGKRFYRSGRTVEDWEQGRRTPDPMVAQALSALEKTLKTARK